MKFIAAILLVVSGTVHADVFVSETQAGGEIVLTMRECKFRGKHESNLREMYTTSKGGRIIGGCWALFDGKVQVIYEDDYSRYSYDMEYFTKREGI